MGTLLPSPHLLSSPRLPSGSADKFDYFRQVHLDPEKRVHFSDRKREWQDQGIPPITIFLLYTSNLLFLWV
jgi:hypothetical protein